MLQKLTQEEWDFVNSRILLDEAMFTSYDCDEKETIASLINKGYVQEIYQGEYSYYLMDVSQIAE